MMSKVFENEIQAQNQNIILSKTEQEEQSNLKKLNKLVMNQDDRVFDYSQDILENFKDFNLDQEIDKNLSSKEIDSAQNHPKQNEKAQKKEDQQTKNIPWTHPEYKPEIEENVEENNQDDNEKSKKKEDFWDNFKKVTKDQIKHQPLSKNQGLYKITEEEMNNPYFKEKLQLIKDYIQYDCHENENDEFKTLQSGQYYKNEETGDQYYFNLQMFKKKDKLDESKTATLIAVYFFIFNQETQEFDLQFKKLLDVILKDVDCEYLMHERIHYYDSRFYYFLKNTKVLEESKETIQSFKLTSFEMKNYYKKYEKAINLDNEIKVEQKFENLEQYDIIVPKEVTEKMKIEDLDICFFQDTITNNQNQVSRENYLKKQFVLVQNFQYLKEKEKVKNNVHIIFQLSNPLNPLMLFKSSEIEQVTQAFFFQKEEDENIFIMLGQKHYEITHKSKEDIIQRDPKNENYSIQKDKRFQICQIDQPCYIFGIPQVFPEKIEVTLQDTSQFLQYYYYVYNHICRIYLLYPFQTQEIPKIEREIQKDLQSKHQQVKKFIVEECEKQQKGLLIFKNNQNIEFYQKLDEIDQFFKSVGCSNKNYELAFMNKDIIIAWNWQGFKDVYSLRIKNKIQKNLIEKINSEEKANIFNKNILMDYQYFQNKQIYQKNHNFEHNLYLNSYYLNKRKQNVLISHNKAYIDNKQFEFDENKLILDLSAADSKYTDPYKLLILYAPQIKNIKLVCYHTSRNNAVFFFLYRRERINSYEGVHFFMLKKMSELDQMIIKQQPLIDENQNTIIYITMQLQNIFKVIYSDKILENYMGRQRDLGSSTQIEFEQVRDLGEPINKWMPFVFYNRRIKNEDYETYLCFMNIEDINWNYQINDEKEDLINFKEYIQVAKLEFISERQYHSMFARSSKWQIVQSNKKQYSATYLFGRGIEQVYSYQVTIDLDQKVFTNQEQQVFNKITNIQSNIQMKPVQTYQLNYQDEYNRLRDNGQGRNCDNRLVPYINSNSEIEGTYYLINTMFTEFGIHKITTDFQLIKQYHDEQNVLDHLEKFIGKNVMIISDNGEYFQGVFSDGSQFKLKYKILQSIQDAHNENIKQGIDQDSKEIIKEFLKRQQPMLIYDLFRLDQFDKPNYINSVQIGNLCQAQFKKISFQNINFTDIEIIKSNLTHDIIHKNYFDKEESEYWIQKIKYFVQNMEQTSFFDMICQTVERKRKEVYYQQFMTLGGKNLCAIDIDTEIINMEKIKATFEEKQNFYDLLYQFDRQESIIYKLIETNRIKELTVLLQFMLKCLFFDFGNIIKRDFALLLSFQKISINEFLNISKQDEQKQDQNQQVCNFEQVLSDQKLPLFGPDQLVVRYITEQDQDDVISYILKKINSDKKNDKDSKNNSTKLVQVQFFLIDFNECIRKIKMDKLIGVIPNKDQYNDNLKFFKQYNSQDKMQFNHLALSNLIKINLETAGFMEQSSVQQIIDIQFLQTRQKVKYLLIFYFFGFVFPFTYNNLSVNEAFSQGEESYWHSYFRFFLHILASFTQISFLLFEFAEINQSGMKEYFSDGWNLFDSSQPLWYTIHFIFRIYFEKIDKLGYLKLFDNMIIIMIIFTSITKGLQYIRYKESYSFFVQMFTQVLIQLMPFFSVFVVFTLIFTFILIIMGGDSSDVEDDYKKVPKFLRIVIQTFRISIGDIKVNDYGQWGVDRPDDKEFQAVQPFALTIIWIFWFVNMFIMLIVMLNLVIAEVGQIYDKVMSLGKTSIYKQRADLNKMVFTIEDFFGKRQEYKMIVIQKPSEGSESYDLDDFTTFSERIKKSISELLNKSKADLLKFNQEKIVDKIEKDQTENKKETGEIKIKLDRSNKNVELINEKLNNLDEKFNKQNEKIEKLTEIQSMMIQILQNNSVSSELSE